MAVMLPSGGWRYRAGLDALMAALGAGQARFVGGAVRDALLGLEVADIDIATRHPPQRIMDIVAGAGIRVVPTGIDHGTVTAVLASGPVEVTTLRRDVETDGRRAVVAFTDDWRADAARRDFTMNALYADPGDGRVIDYFGGLADLDERRVRFIGDPLQRIAEDHLRILRFFRFHARFGDTIDAEGLAACAARANDLMALSRERIAGELMKLLVARHAVGVVALMVAEAILAPVLPEITATTVDRLRALAEREAMCGVPPDPIRRLAALIPADAAEPIGARLKLSKVQRRRLALAVQPLGDASPEAVAYHEGVETAVDRLLLAADVQGVAPTVAMLRQWSVPRLPIGGGALIARGITRGPEVAALLREVERRWIEAGFPPADAVERIADAVVAQAASARGFSNS